MTRVVLILPPGWDYDMDEVAAAMQQASAQSGAVIQRKMSKNVMGVVVYMGRHLLDAAGLKKVGKAKAAGLPIYEIGPDTGGLQLVDPDPGHLGGADVPAMGWAVGGGVAGVAEAVAPPAAWPGPVAAVPPSVTSAPPASGPPVDVMFSNGLRIQIHCPTAATTVAQLMQYVQDAVQIPAQQQRMLFSGRDLRANPNLTLAQAGVGKNNLWAVHVVSPVAPQLQAASAPPNMAGGPVPGAVVAGRGSQAAVAAQGRSSQDAVDLTGAPSETCGLAVSAGGAAMMATAGHQAHGPPQHRIGPQVGGSAGGSAVGDVGSTGSGRKGKGKKRAAEGGEQPDEKRAAKFRSSCPRPVQDRIQRAQTQRLFMVGAEDLSRGGHARHKYSVLGSTGNLYDVTIQDIPECTCPDFQRGNLCKHVLFVYLKILNIPATSPLIYQKALLQSELAQIYSNARQPAKGLMANASVQKAYRMMKGEEVGEENEEEKEAGREVSQDDDCPICFETLKDPQRPMVFCRTGCRNSIHKECLDQWIRAERQHHRQPSCPYCRAPWEETVPAGKAGEGVRMQGAYVNLAALSGQNARRDNSTYSEWYRRGAEYRGVDEEADY